MREWDDCENTVVIFIVLDWIISPIPYILSSSKSRHGVFFLWKPTGWVVKLIMIMGHKWGELWILTSSKGMQDIKKWHKMTMTMFSTQGVPTCNFLGRWFWAISDDEVIWVMFLKSHPALRDWSHVAPTLSRNQPGIFRRITIMWTPWSLDL